MDTPSESLTREIMTSHSVWRFTNGEVRHGREVRHWLRNRGHTKMKFSHNCTIIWIGDLPHHKYLCTNPRDFRIIFGFADFGSLKGVAGGALPGCGVLPPQIGSEMFS